MCEANTDLIHYHYSPLLILNEKDHPDMALIILNSPLGNPPSPIFIQLWGKANIKVCADGGANRLYDDTSTKEQKYDHYIPDIIRGDLDFIRSSVKDYYKKKGVRIEHDGCQETNDLDKCLQFISKEWLSNVSGDFQVCIYGAFGGRFDQEMASIQALYKWSKVFCNKLFLYDQSTSAFLLSENVLNKIRIVFYGDNELNRENKVGDGPTCGLIPIGCKWSQLRQLD